DVAFPSGIPNRQELTVQTTDGKTLTLKARVSQPVEAGTYLDIIDSSSGGTIASIQVGATGEVRYLSTDGQRVFFLEDTFPFSLDISTGQVKAIPDVRAQALTVEDGYLYLLLGNDAVRTKLSDLP